MHVELNIPDRRVKQILCGLALAVLVFVMTRILTMDYTDFQFYFLSCVVVPLLMIPANIVFLIGFRKSDKGWWFLPVLFTFIICVCVIYLWLSAYDIFYLMRNLLDDSYRPDEYAHEGIRRGWFNLGLLTACCLLIPLTGSKLYLLWMKRRRKRAA